AEQPFASVELETPLDEARRGGAWQLRAPGERPPLPGPEGPGALGRFEPLVLTPPLPVAAFATARLLRPGGLGEPFALAEGGGLDSMRVVQFRGTGRIVMRAERAAFSLKIEPDSNLYVETTALLGWIGRVVPRVLHGQDGEPTPYVECTGEGVLILEEPPPAS